ncbi:lysosome membrane protein 2-like isoform X2 [Palaemon carinicauda]|uniref:lysosome membrane protein 2-like isoform X2 n=1 Tax=Palaemon carinicauda TaxID=392227 RepID=UPI0035B5F19D
MGRLPDEGYETASNKRMRAVVNRVNKSARCRCCLWMLAVWCAATVIFMLAGYDTVVHTVAVDQMVLRQGSQKYEAWVDTPVPVYYRVFVFNLTNPEEFMNGDRPRVKETGPYVYLMKESKQQVRFHTNGSVSYRTKPLYFFQPEMSIGGQEDTIITVNIPFVNAADAVKEAGFLRTIIQYAKKIHGFDTIRRLTVGELLWGHRSRVMDWARTLQEVPYPHQLFGLLVGFNDSVQEPYTMHTGKGDAAKMNQIVSWNGHKSLDFWSGDFCNEIRGTDANGFAPGVTKDETLYIFNGQLCRALPLVYNETVTQSGISAYRFVPPDDIFAYGKDHPQNSCFCSGGGCPPTGILDMKPCYWGASVGFSFPHFYNGDPKLRHVVRGLRPDPTKHRTEFDIYPDLGVPLRVKLRMQMNVMLDRNQALERARHYDLVLPIFWFEVGIDSLPGEVVGLLKLAQNLPPVVKTTSVTLCTALTIIFLILLLAQTVAAWCGVRATPEDEELDDEDEERRRTPEPPFVDHHPHHPYLTPPPWDYEGLHKPRRGGSTTSSSLASTLPPPGLDIPIIDDHTLLPPYRRRNNLDLPDAPPQEPDEPVAVDQIPPPYSPGPPQRTPSTVSVEIHTTASDDDLPDLPYDPPVTKVAPLQRSSPDYPALIQPPPETVEEKDEEDEDSSNEQYPLEPERVTPSTPPPLPGEEVVAPLAGIEDTKDIDASSGGVPSPLSSPRTATEPLATSSPHGSSISNEDSRGNLPPPLESDL